MNVLSKKTNTVGNGRQFNLNSIFTIIVGAAVAFVWQSVTKLNDSMARLETAQTITQRTLTELMPKQEILLRFGTVEKDILDLRIRVQALEVKIASELRK